MSSQSRFGGQSDDQVRICWFDDIFKLFQPLPYPLAALIIGVACYAVASLPLVVGGQARLALDLPFVLGLVGIVLCTAFARWTTLRYRKTIDSLVRILEPSSHTAFDEARAKTLRMMAATKETLIVAFILWMIGTITVTGTWLYGVRLGVVVPMFDFMPAHWYQPGGIVWRLVAAMLLALPVSTIVWTGGRLLVLHTLLILSLRRMQFIASPVTCVQVLRPALTLGVAAALYWSVGVILFVILLRDRVSFDRLLFLSLLGGVGTFAFTVPILGLRPNLISIRQQRVDHLTMLIVEKVKMLSPDEELLEDIDELERRVVESSRLGPLIMGWRYLGWFLTVVLLPVCIAILQHFFNRLLGFLD